jgi:RsiW-degrading membrane proteinase PrsW (M82 family)
LSHGAIKLFFILLNGMVDFMDFYYRLPIYIFFGLLPSLIWLFYYLQKDLHPEPKRMIVKIFFYGVLITIPVFFIQIGLFSVLNQLREAGLFDGWPIIAEIIKWFFVIALTEETLKYVVVKFQILKSPEVDEPLDFMLYMVVVALGFAALENALYLFSPVDHVTVGQVLQATITIAIIRFVGATFLHTLCSALVGYCIAKGSLLGIKGRSMVIMGIVIAAGLHGLYDFSIITLSAPLDFLIPGTIILVLAGFIMYDFDGIQKVRGICKLS